MAQTEIPVTDIDIYIQNACSVKNRSVKITKLDRFIALKNFIFSIVSVTGYFSTALALVFQGFSSIFT
jgi:hypothetical protein